MAGGSWEEAGRRVEELARSFVALGLEKGDAVAIMGNTRLEWALVDLALAHVGAVVVPIFATSPAGDCEYILRHSEAVALVCEDEEMRERCAGVSLRHVLTFAQLAELPSDGGALPAIGEDDLLKIVYTSGTTGPPKGCMMLHRNYAVAVDALEASELILPGDVVLLFLPLAHSYPQLVLYGGVGLGFTVALCPDLQKLPSAMQQVRPTAMPGVPRVYEKAHARVRTQFERSAGVKRRLVDWALGVGYRVSRLRREGRRVPPGLAVQHRLADRLVYSKVKARFGGRLRAGVTGAAPMPVEIVEFFHALDILVLEGYGLTECASACSVNLVDRFRFGTVGPPLPGVEVRTGGDGEILVRAKNVFAGYFKDEEATRAAIDAEGWLHTGDVGELDEDGFLRITDRKKDLIVTAGGKNVAPQNLENDLQTSKYVSHALVLGDRRPYLVALITLDEAETDGREDVEKLIRQVVDEVNRGRAAHEQIRRFAVLPRDFGAEHDEVTPTMKLKRKVAADHFADVIEGLYRR